MALVLRVFVGMGFGSGCWAGTDDSNLIRAAVGVSKEEDPLPQAAADGDGAPLANGMVRPINPPLRQWPRARDPHPLPY